MLENARKTNLSRNKRKKCVHLLGTGLWDSASGDFSKQ